MALVGCPHAQVAPAAEEDDTDRPTIPCGSPEPGTELGVTSASCPRIDVPLERWEVEVERRPPPLCLEPQPNCIASLERRSDGLVYVARHTPRAGYPYALGGAVMIHAVGDGWLYGANCREGGGGLAWLTSSHRIEEVEDETGNRYGPSGDRGSTRAIVDVGSGVWVVAASTNRVMMLRAGVYEARRDADGKWHTRKFAELHDFPVTACAETKTSALVVSSRTIVRASADGTVAEIYRDAPKPETRPFLERASSVANDDDGRIFVLGAHIVRLTPRSGGGYDEARLQPPEVPCITRSPE
jgi:hypothetical protein